MNRIFHFFFPLTLLLAISTAGRADTSDRLVQLIDYVGVDYSEAVSEGTIVNQGEYAEMVEFTAIIETSVASIAGSPIASELLQQARELGHLIKNKAPAGEVRALAHTMRTTIIHLYDLKVAPDQAPDLLQGQALYQETCATCHGAYGNGNGELGKDLDPQPTDFTEVARFRQRSLYALFNTITYGVEGTGMSDYSQLSTVDRWNLAAYVGSIGVDKEVAANGKRTWQQFNGNDTIVDVKAYAGLSPDEAANKWTKGYALMAYLRTEPEVLFDFKTPPLTVAMNSLQTSLKAYEQGETEKAYEFALTAYLEGFELVEANLAALDTRLMRDIESEMLLLRNDIGTKSPLKSVAARIQKLQLLLQQAQSKMADKGGLTPTAAFVTSFIILLREGLEAILVVVALSAFLLKTDRRDAMPYLHAGWIAALILGLLTWVASERFVQISGATREVTEGVAALVASGMLLFVGYWLHSKTSASGWQAFIQKSLKAALNKRTLWGLAGLSFISVYREVFETILFYQALWAQAASSSADWVTGGFLVAALLLVLLAALIIRFSVKIPLRHFFASTGILLLILSFIFAGKGIAALQAAGEIQQTMLQFEAVEWLGIFPSQEGLLIQATILLASAVFLSRGFFARRQKE
ncbi:FTR1 family protein [Kordiimonas aquimaris]|uniref:FTR1 family protein n=1 Tax=Kordiimonas aquimaris TaxID=707591 RepID=UPI0021D31EE6|nr:FTR1 family protein [Kordiimonas aquimaris]